MPGYLELVIRRIVRETPQTATWILEPAGSQPFHYRSGQFLTLLFTINGQEIRRAYSLGSSPAWHEPLSITIRRKHNGLISRLMLDHFREGDVLRSLEPSGLFTLDSAGDKYRDIFLFGAGSGIVPLFSLLKTLLREEPGSRISLIYSNTRKNSVIFLKQLKKLEYEYGSRFSCQHILSHAAGDMEAIQGHLNNGLVEQLVKRHLHFDRKNAEFLICGPASYMRMVMLTIRYMGFSGDRIRKEIFEVDPAPPPPPFSSRPITVWIISVGEVQAITVPPQATILQAALDQELRIPYSCRGGVCSTCICRLLHGRVMMTVNEVLTDNDQRLGLILTCTGYPLDNEVVLELGPGQINPAEGGSSG